MYVWKLILDWGIENSSIKNLFQASLCFRIVCGIKDTKPGSHKGHYETKLQWLLQVCKYSSFESDEHPGFVKTVIKNTSVWGTYYGQMKTTKCEVSLINLIVEFNSFDCLKFRNQHNWFMMEKKIHRGGAVGCAKVGCCEEPRVKTQPGYGQMLLFLVGKTIRFSLPAFKEPWLKTSSRQIKVFLLGHRAPIS